MDERHFIDVNRSAFRSDHWWARCSCGWKSDLKPRKIEATMDGDEHIELIHETKET